ncbi:sterol 26-hydroxylase, mitochondrial-like [Protopterus annectens]|uniref:sterol 26-hydroxylase, mitochondrial-like n=1 Tax=Protopterus annectens TaxID=7888 RepID=UPI001CF9A83D|nr:sterol 26-hydroxylase, mitochondrial-like [Protopterus annectens]
MAFKFRGTLCKIFFARGASRGLLQPFPVTPCCVHQQCVLNSGTAAATFEDRKALGSPDDLSGPTFLNNFYWMFFRGYITHMQDLQIIQKKMYGPMWKSLFGPYKSISVANAELLEELLRQEGKYPMRNDMAIWKEHRDKRNFAYGPLTEEGERWHKLRTALNKKILKPKDVAVYCGAINEVVSDFIKKLYYLRENSPSGVLVSDIANEFYRFAFEGVCCVIFETRLGCLEKNIPKETQEFINSVGIMLHNSVYATVLPKWTRSILPYWNRYLEGWDTLFAYAKKLVDKKMENIQARLDRGEVVEGEFLTTLLANANLSMHEIYGSMPELLQAGVDTTSNTLAWVLYHLSRDPGIQNSLYKEVMNVVPDRAPTVKDIDRMPLLKAVIKETLRMYPVVPVNGRVAAEKDIVLNGICFPKNTQFQLCHYVASYDEKHFPDPHRFDPTRWLRDVGMKHHPFGSIPFGYGVRACVGRRFAELEMRLALIGIIKKFELQPDPSCADVKAISRIVLIANKPINLQFIERQSQK